MARCVLERRRADRFDSLDAHPLVRAYFAGQLRKEQPEAFREGHLRL